MAAQPQILLAERQHEVISSAQLHRLGWSRHEIAGVIGRGWLHPVYRGVYSVGTRLLTPHGRCMAAVLASGDGAVLSHRSAGALWGLIAPFPTVPEVSVEPARRARKGIRLYQRPLPADEITTVDGIAVTTVARTLLDLAAIVRRSELERAMNEAEYRRLWDPLGLPILIARHPGRTGIGTMRAILADGEIAATKEELEKRFMAFLKKRRLPLPQTNVDLELKPGKWIKPDCVWPHARLIVELDGRAAHSTRKRFDGDRSRDRRLDLAGWTVWRVTAYHLKHEADQLEADLRQRLSRR